MTAATTYVIAIGSNRPISRSLSPAAIVAGVIQQLDRAPLIMSLMSPSIETRPLGSARRRFVNAAAIVETELSPLALLAHLKRLERSFGRRSGRRWGDRSLDLDIIFWSEGIHRSRRLQIPHVEFRRRRFVLDPLLRVTPHWRDPVTKLTVRHLAARSRKAKPVDR